VELATAARQDPVAIARDFQPDLVAHSVITGSQRYYLDLNCRLKAEPQGVYSVFRGPHPTFFPEMVEACANSQPLPLLDPLIGTMPSGGDALKDTEELYNEDW
jgi:hypothetical protein